MMYIQSIKRFSGCGHIVQWNSILHYQKNASINARQFIRGKKTYSDSSSEPFFLRYWKSLKWVPIPMGVGFAYIGYQHYPRVVKREERKLQQITNPEDGLPGDWVITLYRCLPLKIMSRIWGKLNNIELPMWMRSPLYKAYIWAFNCNLEEAAIRDLQHYRCLAEFFRRRLRPGVRPVDRNHVIVSPSDGKVLHFGKSEKGAVEQVKGITYSLQQFLGPPTWPKKPINKTDLAPEASMESRCQCERTYEETVKHKPDTILYHCVIYLAPGDYHGFHSPTEWVISHRRHFPGELFSVNPGVARLIKGLFNWNERAAYIGDWKEGFFSMTLVGATNVGSIIVYHDRNLETNEPYKYPNGSFFDECFHTRDLGGVSMKKGESFGEFNLGSTVVLVFEAPIDFKFNVQPGQTIKMGEPLGHRTKS